MKEDLPKLQRSTESNERIAPVYTALFVRDVSALQDKFPPHHANVYGHHSTIAFRPGSLDGIDVGAEGKIAVIGRVHDEKGDALLVHNPKSTNKFPHITLSCAEGVRPVYSNEMIERAALSGSITKFDPPIELDVIEGYFDGKNTIVTP